MDTPETDDRHDLPLDEATMDVVCRRNPDGTCSFSIPRRHVHHSPTGWRWGYGGSGPADFALNVLALFVGPAPDPSPEPAWDDEAAWAAAAERSAARVELWDGTAVHVAAWNLHHEFKREVIARLPEEGGTIAGDEVRAWLRARGVEPAR